MSLIETMVAFDCSCMTRYSPPRPLTRSRRIEVTDVLRARPNPWSARRRGHLSEQDLASPLHIVGRRQVFDADHIIILMRAVALAGGLARFGRFLHAIRHCRTVSWCGHQYELSGPKASRAPRDDFVSSRCSALTYSAKIHLGRFL